MVTVEGYEKTRYVKDIRYNNSSLPGQRMEVDARSIAQKLDVEFGSGPAVLTGTVTYSADFHRNALVGLVPQPSPNPHSSAMYCETDPQDGFQFIGLRPGDYVVFALPTEEREYLNRPSVLQRLVHSGKTLKLSPQTRHTTNIELAAVAAN